MYKLYKNIALFSLCLILTGCAHLSKETVLLADEQNTMIQSSRDSHTALLDAYAQSRRERIDEYMQSTWIPTFIENMAKGGDLWGKVCETENACTKVPELQGFVLAAAKKIAEKRKGLTDALDNALSELRYELDRHYNILQLSNKTVADNLKSVELNKAVDAKIQEKLGLEPPAKLKEISDKLDKMFLE